MSKLKLHFDPDIGYQKDAVDSVVNLFRGQEKCRSEFTVIGPKALYERQHELDYTPEEKNRLGIGNKLELLPEEIVQNLIAVQFHNGIEDIAETLKSHDFTVEMETGTGKTYVYLRTIFELHKEYDFTKFIIVVPSVAIKEGVKASIKQMTSHFLTLYPDAAGFKPIVYDSSRMSEVRDFATSNQIRIMIMTVGAINKKDVNNIYVNSEKTDGAKPIDLIRDTRPILIVDEPQSVDGGLSGKGKQALEALNPLCSLRYSATHAHQYHPVFRFDSVEAYNAGYVKQIEVASLQIEGDHNKPYIRVIGIDKKRGAQPTARLELDIERNGTVSRKVVTVNSEDKLEQITHRELYRDIWVGKITASGKNSGVELFLPSSVILLQEGEETFGLDDEALARLMIRRTIKEHLDKEKTLRPQGIKVLSLFFLPKVDTYRIYQKDGTVEKGPYARIFEEEYRRFIQSGEYSTLFEGVDTKSLPEEVHDGYFAMDKKMHSPFEELSLSGNKDDQDTTSYNLIMKEKEKLLSFDTKLKFIFSHSALREGWDNPNVFQICSLRDMQSERERRQTIGRGLRLCVNQNGDRLMDENINTLTVIASESYERYAQQLQQEIERDTGIIFGLVRDNQFAAVPITDQESGKSIPLGVAASREVYDYLKKKEYLDNKDKVTSKLKEAIVNKDFALPDTMLAKQSEKQIVDMLTHLSSRVRIKDANKRQMVAINKERYLDPSFKALWDRIKHKTTYRIHFEDADLEAKCAQAILNEMPSVTPMRARFVKAAISIDKGGVGATKKGEGVYERFTDMKVPLPDILTDLEMKTKLTRKVLVNILINSRRLEDFRNNPQQFIELASTTINKVKRELLVSGITYKKIGDTEFYAQELLEQEELKGQLEKNMLPVERSIYSHVIYDSGGVEKNFAQQLENNESVKVYVKLPSWFQVPTPMGFYNPDWAIVIEEDGQDKLYLVVETKGSMWWDDIRSREGGKIACAREHFKAIATGEPPALYRKGVKLEDVL